MHKNKCCKTSPSLKKASSCHMRLNELNIFNSILFVCPGEQIEEASAALSENPTEIFCPFSYINTKKYCVESDIIVIVLARIAGYTPPRNHRAIINPVTRILNHYRKKSKRNLRWYLGLFTGAKSCQSALLLC